VSDRTGPTHEAEENKRQMLDTKPDIVLVPARLVAPLDHWAADKLMEFLEYRTESVLVFD